MFIQNSTRFLQAIGRNGRRHVDTFALKDDDKVIEVIIEAE
jgi:hypothetical protein